MKHLYLILTLAFLTASYQNFAQLTITEIGTLPEPVANSAVCEGFIDGVPYLYSFAGIDSTKLYSGTHLHSYRINLETGESEQIADLPGDQGLLGTAASRIGNIIYIIGGYTANSNGSEVSSRKVRRYDIENNIFLADAADLLVATDDHVQAVWRDSLLYVVTGWSNSSNIRFTQIYDPTTDSWSNVTFLPNDVRYLSFGASGAIVNDTIYYFGGARSEGQFGIQNGLRKGVINPSNPTEIEWSISEPGNDINGYRMAATTIADEVHWIGGSNNTYNFDGIAYDGSGGVAPANQDVILNTTSGEISRAIYNAIPMDLRGIANIETTVKYIAGGMLANQQVSDKVFRLEWTGVSSSSQDDNVETPEITIFPNPTSNRINIVNAGSDSIIAYNLVNNLGEILTTGTMAEELSVRDIPLGIYHLELITESGKKVSRRIRVVE